MTYRVCMIYSAPARNISQADVPPSAAENIL